MAHIQVTYMSQALWRTVPVQVILPADKATRTGELLPPRKFKTLYLLHGLHGSSMDWITRTRIIRWAEAQDLAVVMPSGDNSFYVDKPDAQNRYCEFIGKELVEITRRMFPLSDQREDTFIGGLSMGGYGALTNGLKYGETFGYVVALSAALILGRADTAIDDVNAPYVARKGYLEDCFGDLAKVKGSDMDYEALLLNALKAKKPLPKLYFACGTEDGLIEANRAYVRFLKKNKVDCTFVEAPGVHDWNFWDEHILKAMDWLPLEGKTDGINSGNVK